MRTEESQCIRLNKRNNQFDDESKLLKVVAGSQIGVRNSQYQYVIVDYLGRGQYGCVYDAINIFDHQHYAIKIFKSSEYYAQAALDETNIFLKLNNSDNSVDLRKIVKYYSTFTFKGHVCIVLEMLSFSLYDVLRERRYKGLPFYLVKMILNDIAKGLKVFHDLGLSHLDVKPENILLESYSSSNVKLADVGSAQYHGKLNSSYVVTRYYRPPEIVLKNNLSEKVDIWSLGCLAVEMISGRVLFDATNELELLNLIEGKLEKPIPAHLVEKSPVSDDFYNGKTLRSYQNGGHNLTLEELIANIVPPSNYSEKQIEKEQKSKGLFIDLIKNMLDPNPLTRFSIDEVISHPFLKSE